MLAVYILVALAAAGGVLFLFTKPRPKYGMCPRGGPRWKNMIGTLMIRSSRKKGNYQIDPQIVNRCVPVPEGQSQENYNDSFVFQGSDREGNLFMTRLGFREGGESAEVWVWTALGGGKYSNPVTFVRPAGGGKPGQAGGSTEAAAGDGSREVISAAGLTYRCGDIESGVWSILYDGKMEPGNLDCSIDLRYDPVSAMYHSGLHMDPNTFARAMAEMPWTKEFFDNLKSENQIRIEQGGRLSGKIRLNDRTHDISMIGVRDHSWGKRDWTFINRYIWNVLSFTDALELKGERFTHLCYTTVNYGTSFKCLVSGWIAGKNTVLPITAATDQGLIGEDGVIPDEIDCMFQPKGCRPLSLKIWRTGAEHSWYMGNNGDGAVVPPRAEFEVCEAFCAFETEGCGGVGMSEFGYSRPAGHENRFTSSLRRRRSSGRAD